MTMSTEQQPQWRHSSYCGTNACVEVAQIPGSVLLRDSKNPDVAPFVFSTAEWTAFMKGVQAGEFSQ
ncbi:DUF397 domain-containing protein [Actinoplanes sp. NPDC049118]|uniref:DUF397 domain-containing protein n=1 Tax=Actinoplanes sp. NPDC049118 TaxID=3155769 RepID=UPI00340DE8FE